MSCKQPLFIKKQIELESVNSGIAVELARQAVSGRSALQEVQYTGCADQLVDPRGGGQRIICRSQVGINTRTTSRPWPRPRLRLQHASAPPRTLSFPPPTSWS